MLLKCFLVVGLAFAPPTTALAQGVRVDMLETIIKCRPT